MSLVREVCATCGKQTAELAVVMDPFMDSCYGICRACLAGLHYQQTERIKRSLDAAVGGKT